MHHDGGSVNDRWLVDRPFHNRRTGSVTRHKRSMKDKDLRDVRWTMMVALDLCHSCCCCHGAAIVS